MDLVLTFCNHTISGDGSDDIGRFFLAGGFDVTKGECYWTKTYISAHEVYLPRVSRGQRDLGIMGIA